MGSYLIVANRTLGSPGLDEAIRQRLSAGQASFHVVVPATPVGRGLTWDEGESREAAENRLAALIDRIRELGGLGEGEIGVSDPVDAVRDAMRDREIEEVILSTLPPGISRWLGQDIPSRLRGAVNVPVVVVTASPETASTSSS
jgi:hypothetical protein